MTALCFGWTSSTPVLCQRESGREVGLLVGSLLLVCNIYYCLGVVAYVEIRADNEYRNEGVKAELESLGAKVEKNFTKKVGSVFFGNIFCFYLKKCCLIFSEGLKGRVKRASFNFFDLIASGVRKHRYNLAGNRNFLWSRGLELRSVFHEIKTVTGSSTIW